MSCHSSKNLPQRNGNWNWRLTVPRTPRWHWSDRWWPASSWLSEQTVLFLRVELPPSVFKSSCSLTVGVGRGCQFFDRQVVGIQNRGTFHSTNLASYWPLSGEQPLWVTPLTILQHKKRYRAFLACELSRKSDDSLSRLSVATSPRSSTDGLEEQKCCWHLWANQGRLCTLCNVSEKASWLSCRRTVCEHPGTGCRREGRKKAQARKDHFAQSEHLVRGQKLVRGLTSMPVNLLLDCSWLS